MTASPTIRTKSAGPAKTVKSPRPTKAGRSRSASLLMDDGDSEQATTPITFDPDGDLHLAVGTAKVNPLRFVVCSRTLARASPVFKTMLFGGFSESRFAGLRRASPPTPPYSDYADAATSSEASSTSSSSSAAAALALPPTKQDEWTVELPDDDPRAFRILMGIIHSSFAEHVPESLGLVELFHVAILTDKYDMTHLLRPWAEGWCAAHRHRRHPYRLWIAWVLGDEAMFESEARRLALGCQVNANGQLLVRCTNGNLVPLETFDYLRLPDILESIAATRFEAADQILQKITSVHRRLATANGRHCKEPVASTRQECRLDCENALLGSMVKALDAVGLWPIPSPPLLTISLDTLVANVGGAAQLIRPLSSYSGISVGAAAKHTECNPGVELEDFARRVLADVPSPVQHFHLSHLAMQAEKSGLARRGEKDSAK